ncbi:MAG: hypothetical protein OXT64_01710, partial [Gammaproteobacteria bacterium]|nr:hypothetical protein [Gammaproteobacteria bacterium]
MTTGVVVLVSDTSEQFQVLGGADPQADADSNRVPAESIAVRFILTVQAKELWGEPETGEGFTPARWSLGGVG